MSFLRPKVTIPPPPPAPEPPAEPDYARAAALSEEAMAAERGRRKGRGSTIVTGLTDEQKTTIGRPTLLG